jgi:cation:H+ antiporter
MLSATATMYAQLLGGFVLLLGGADVLVRGAATIAQRFAISSLAVGMTIVAFGTSAPELMVTLDAALAGSPDIGVGNVVGSNIANLLLIIGSSAAICPIKIGRPLRFDAVVLGGVSLLFTALALRGVLEWWAGMLLIVALALFLVSAGRREQERRRRADPARDQRKAMPGRGWVAWLGILAGLIGVVVGADLLVRGSVAFARAAGVSEAVIGLSLIAVGTSLPELAASAAAAIRRHPEISLGNVIGSNIFNMLCVAGVVAALVPLPVAEQIRSLDVWVMLAATALLISFLFTGFPIGRVVGLIFLGLYAGYIAILVNTGDAGVGAWAS